MRVSDDAMWRSAACAHTQVTVWRVNYHINPDHTGTKEMATVPAAHLDSNKSHDYWRKRGGLLMWQESWNGGCPA